jgi:hypothetical protein
MTKQQNLSRETCNLPKVHKNIPNNEVWKVENPQS